MKSVLISVKPKWCELIASGKKTIEVRKTRPKLETPFKCYVYCTDGFCSPSGEAFSRGWRKQVIGEFVCDNIMRHCGMQNADLAEIYGCIKREKLFEYADGKELYGWHISDLVIYDKPKELSEFTSSEYVYGKIRMPGHKMERPPQSWCYVEELR